MKKDYPICLDGKTVGSAAVERQGLYYAIRCRCILAESVLYKIVARNGDSQADLGICVPMDGTFGLETRIPVKRIGEGEMQFFILPRHGSRNGRFVPISPHEPFLYISRLKDAYLAVRDGQTGIVLKE